jgi:hypothetical protein
MAPPPTDEQQEFEKMQAELEQRRQQLDAAKQELNLQKLQLEAEKTLLQAQMEQVNSDREHMNEVESLRLKESAQEDRYAIEIEKLKNQLTEMGLKYGSVSQ